MRTKTKPTKVKAEDNTNKFQVSIEYQSDKDSDNRLLSIYEFLLKEEK